jgi:hypothetical protein
MKLITNSILLVTLLALLTACAPAPPSNPQNICNIFKQYPRWYKDTKASQKKWGVPISVQMAIIYQESGFKHDAKPERGTLLWVIPWKRPSNAYGYSQALDSTWDLYLKKTGNNGDRDEFEAATDFIGWYGYQAHKEAKIPRNDAYKLYLAYHDGIGGYKRNTYKNKVWLKNIAKRVQARATLYQKQLERCR